MSTAFLSSLSRVLPGWSQTLSSIDNAYESILNRVKDPERARTRRPLHVTVTSESPPDVARDECRAGDRREECRAGDRRED